MPLIRLLVIFLIASSALAQQEPSSPRTKKQSSASDSSGSRASKSASASSKNKVDLEVKRRREIAVGSLTTLAVEARSYQDEALRARVQARVADVLWNEDPDAARTLFRRAWEAAQTFETQPATGNAVPGRMNAGRSPAGARPRTNLRAEILKLAAARDYRLGEEFLKLMTASTEATGDPKASTNLSQTEIRERLRLANEFLENDNIPRALQFADPAIVNVTTQTISFLVALREKDPVAADQRFAPLLARAAADVDSDANTVSLLTTYAFTPWIFLAVSPEGIPSSNSFLARSAPNISSALRSAYFRTAANILLRPFSQLDQSSAGRAGTYYIAARLLPLFQQHAPDLAPAISSQLTALGPEAARAAHSAGDRSLNRGLTAETAGRDLEGELKDRLERARNSDERDRAYAFASMQAAEAGEPTAYDFLNKIEDLETRKGIRRFVDYSLINGYLKKTKVDEAIQLARSSDISHPLRAHIFTRAGEVIAKTDEVRANELLEEGLAEARRIDAGTPERAYSLVSLLASFAKFNRVRAWELVSETVKAGNAAPNFTGENGNTRWEVGGKFSIAMGTELASASDLSESFEALARDDFYQAMDIGRNFSADAPRALVTISIARATLEEKKH